MLLPHLVGRIKILKVGVKLLDAHDIGKRSAGGLAQLFGIDQHAIHLRLHAGAEMRLRGIDARGIHESIAVNREQPRDKQQVTGAYRLTVTGPRGHYAGIDAARARLAHAAQRDGIDLDAPFFDGETRCRHRDHARCGRIFGEVRAPHFVERREIRRVAQVHLALHHVGERRTGGFERRLEFLFDRVFGLKLDRHAFPQMASRQPHFGGETVGEHQRIGKTSGDEHEIARRHREAVARALVYRVRLGPDVLHAHAVGRRHHLHFDVLAGEQEARHQDGSAGWDVIAERGTARAMIRRHCAVVVVILIDAHDIGVTAAARFQHAAKVREYAVRLAPVFGAFPIRQRGFHDSGIHTAREIRIAFVSGGENPVARLDAGRVTDAALPYRHR